MGEEREWNHHEHYSSRYGVVYPALGNAGWIGKVNLVDGRQARLSETFDSAPVAMCAVKRTWEREVKKNGGS